MSHDESLLSLFFSTGPVQLFLAALVVAIGIYHFAMLVRILVRSREAVTVGFHALLLFAGPCIVLLQVLAFLPTTLPIFLYPIDAREPIVHSLAVASVLGALALLIFIPNLCLTLLAICRLTVK
ncbi:MAG TPA: hypothetical protein VF614_06445 [Chthoniobacteraceae bacterium]|jgi:hypothetical protein